MNKRKSKKQQQKQSAATIDSLLRRLSAMEARLASNEIARRSPDPVVVELDEEEGPSGSVIWFDDRFYRVETDRGVVFYPSVTTVLGAAYPHQELERWRARLGYQQANQIMREAADKGSIIHQACHVYATGGLVHYQTHGNKRTREQLSALRELNNGNMIVIYDQEHMLHVHRFSLWLEAVKGKVLAAECTLASHTHQIAGTMDLLLEIPAGTYNINGSDPVKIQKDGLYIVDLKTGSGVWDSHYVQIAAYAAMLEEPSDMMPTRVDGGMILHTGASTRSGIPGVATHIRNRSMLDADFETFQHAFHLYHAAGAVRPRIYDIPTMLKRRT